MASISDTARTNLLADVVDPNEATKSNVDLFKLSSFYNAGAYAGLSAGEGYYRYVNSL